MAFVSASLRAPAKEAATAEGSETPETLDNTAMSHLPMS